MPRSYDKRLLISTVGSAILHTIGILALLYFLFAQHGAGPSQGPVTYLVKLGSAPPEPKELAESTAPTTKPPADSDRIAETDSQAQDMSDVEGTRNAPFFKQASETDILARTAPPSLPSSPPTPPPPPASPSPPPQPSPQEAAPVKKSEPVPDIQPPKKPAQVMAARIPETPPNTKPAEPKPVDTTSIPPATSPLSPSQAEFSPPISPLALPKTQESQGMATLPQGTSRGQIDGGVKNEGFVAYEAIRDKVAPYLKTIRARVERNWQTSLHLKYLGTSPTKAVLDCAIGPDGKLVAVNIVDAGDATGYAAICKEALERAAPFDPFPFQVPDMYQSKNLEIRWTFNFLPQ